MKAGDSPSDSLLALLRRVPAGLLALTALAMALIAQLALSGWAAAVVYLGAAAIFVHAAHARSTDEAGPRPTRALLLAGYALAVTAALATVVYAAEGDASFPPWGLVSAWLTAVAAYALAWFRPSGLTRLLVHAWRLHRAELLLGLALVSVGLFLRVFALDHFPRTMGGDDGQAALNARAVLKGELGSPFGTVSIGPGHFPALYFFGEAALMRVFGDDVAGSRAWSALVGSAAVGGVYLLGRQWFGWRVGATAALVLAVLPYHLYWSRSPMNNVADTLAVVLVLLLATRAFATARPLHFALAGLALGLAQYGYQSARLLFLVVAVLALREVLVDRGWLRHNLGNLGGMAGGVAVAFLPLAFHFANHPLEFHGRLTQVSILHGDWLEQEMATTGQSSIWVVAEHLRDTLLVFHAVPPRMFFEPGRPLLDPLSGVLFVFGAALAMAGLRQRASFALLVALLAYLLAAGLTENAPNGPRLVATAPLAALLVALGLARTAELVAFGRPWLRTAALAVMAKTIAVLGIHFYFFEYASTPRYEYSNSVAATDLAYHMRQFPPGTRFLFLAQPRMSCTTHASVQFIAPDWSCVDVPEPSAQEARPVPGPGDVVVALPERVQEAELLVEGLGLVRVRELRQPGAAEPSARAFELPSR